MRALLHFIAMGARLVRALGPLGGILWASLPISQFLLAPFLAYALAKVFAPPGPAALYAVATLGVLVLAAADHGKGFSAATLGADVRRRGVESRQRLAADRVRRQWETTCTQLGWDVRAVEDDDGPVRPLRRPELRLVQHLGDRLRVVWRPRGDQPPKEWPNLVDALRRQLGGHSADFREVPTEPGTIVATFGLSPLPGVVPYQATPPTTADGLSARFPLGFRAGGGEAVWYPDQSPGLLIAGSTGGGKGGVLRLITLRALELRYEPTVLDPKATGENRWAHEHGVPVHHDLENQVDALRATAQDVRDRCAVLWDAGVDRVGVLPESERPPFRLLIVDECADLLMLRRVPTEKAADELRSEAGALLSVIASQGRAAGIRWVLSIQRPDVALLGPSGGFLRSNCPGRIAIGRMDAEGIDMMFGDGHRDRVVALTGQPGRALAAHLAAGEVEPYGLQAAWVDAESLRPEPVSA